MFHNKQFFAGFLLVLVLGLTGCNVIDEINNAEQEDPTITPTVEVLIVTATTENEPQNDTPEPSPTATAEPDQPTATAVPPTQPPQPQGPTSLEELKNVIRGAIGGGGGSINDLPPALSDEFATCGYQAGCGVRTGQERIDFIINQLPIGQDITIDPDVMQPPLYMNYDPNTSFLSKGWVDNGQGEAVLFYEVENGIYKWSGGVWVTKPFAVIDYESSILVVINEISQAVMNRDWAAMQQLAPNDLKLLSLNGSFFPDQYNGPQSAMGTIYLPPSANPLTTSSTINGNGPDYSAELGFSVYDCCNAIVVGALKMNGWGANGTGQAILVVHEYGPDAFQWFGFYYENGGF